MLDMDLLKDLVVHWIDHGQLPEEHEASGGHAFRIASFLRSQNHEADDGGQASLRMACVALTAPALETALIMTRLSQGYLDVMAKSHCQTAQGLPEPDLDRSAIARTKDDDTAAQQAFASLAGHYMASPRRAV